MTKKTIYHLAVRWIDSETSIYTFDNPEDTMLAIMRVEFADKEYKEWFGEKVETEMALAVEDL